MLTKLLILLVFLSYFLNCKAAENVNSSENASQKNDKNATENVQKNEKRTGIIAFPIVFYSSDTSVGFGASAVLHKEHYKDEYVSKSNSLALVFFYTLRNQLLNANVGNLYWDHANWHWKSKLVFKKYPTDFYGIGNDTRTSAHEVFEPFTFQFENSVNRRIWKSFYAGI